MELFFCHPVARAQNKAGGISDSVEVENPTDDSDKTENADKSDDNQGGNTDNDENEGNAGEDNENEGDIEANLWATDYTFTVIAQYKTDSGTCTTASTQTGTNYLHIQWQNENGTNYDWGNTGKSKNSTAVINDNNGTADCSYFSYNFYSLGSNKRRAKISALNGFAICGISTSSSWSNSSYTSSYSYAYFYGGSSSSTVRTSTSAPSASSVGSQISSCTIYVKLRREYDLKFFKSTDSNDDDYIIKKVDMLAGVSVSTTSPSSITMHTIGYIPVGFSTTKNIKDGNYTWGLGVTVSYSASSVNKDIELFSVETPSTYYIDYNYSGGSSGTYAPSSAVYDTVVRISNPSRTGYTFMGWSASNIDYWKTGYSEVVYAKYGTSSSNVTTHWMDNGSYVKATYFINLNSDSETVTFTAHWQANTYTLTLYYAGKGQTNETDFTVSASGCTIAYESGSSVGYPSSEDTVKVSHTYTTSTVSVKISLTNDASYDYYMRIGSAPTTSSYTYLFDSSSDSYSYSWKPTANSQINIYIYQRYTITYNKNNGSGTTPGTPYKIHNTDAALGSNSLTRTYYTANGWNTNSSGTGTHYNNGESYSTNANLTLYADWTPITSTVKVQIKTSTDGTTWESSNAGGYVTVTYYRDNNNSSTSYTQIVNSSSLVALTYTPFTDRVIRFTGHATTGSGDNASYAFIGVSTSSSGITEETLITTFTPPDQDVSYTVYAYFKKVSANRLKYDSTDKYWYFEDGEYPQSYVGDSLNSTLIGAATSANESISYFNGTTNVSIPIYSYNGERYARLTASKTMTIQTSVGSVDFTSGHYYFFKVEPIRWRVSEYGVSSTDYPDGWDAYGSYKTNFTVVSDRVLMASAVTNQTVSEGWAFTSSELFSNVSISNTNSASAYANLEYDTNTSVKYYKFGNAGQQDKVTTVSRTENGLRVASVDEIEESFEDIRAYASDMVCFLLGIGRDEYANYWTRTLGTNLGNGKIITSAGMDTSSWLDNMFGVRFATTLSESIRI